MGGRGAMTTAPIRLQDLRRRLYVKAKAEKDWRCWGLYVHVTKLETLNAAYTLAKQDNGAPGIDGVTFAAIEEAGVEAFLAQLRAELVSRSYRPLRNRRVEIPKGEGKVRVLGIPAIRDRVVQGALKLILEPIFEGDFHDGSYGYRPKRTAQQAVDRVAEAIVRSKTRVIDVDLAAYFGCRDIVPPDSWCGVKEVGMVGHDLDSQAFSLPAAHVDGGELAAFYPLQHRLSGHAETQPRFEHRQVAWGSLFDEARPQLVGHADAPGGAGRELFTDDDAGSEPAVQRRRRDAEDRGGLLDGEQFAVSALGERLAPGDVAVAAQTSDVQRREALPAGGAFALAIEDAGDDGIGVMRGETANEGEAVFVGSNARGTGAQADMKFGDGAPAPTQGQVRAALVAFDGEHDLLQQGTQELLLVAIGRGGGGPDASKIVAEGAEAFGVDLAEGAPPLMLAGLELALRDFKIPQALLPLGFEAASHETIFRFDRAIPALGAFGSIPRALDRQPPLRERGLIIVVELLRGDERGVDGGRSEGREERRGDGLVDLDPADGEAVDAAARDEILARAVIARRGRAPAVMRVQPATAVPAGGEALQQRGAFSHGATRQVWMRVDVAIDARLIGFVRLPVNEAFVVTREEDAPVGARQPANSLLDGAVRRDVPLAARSTIDVGASIYRIGEQMVNRGVRRHDPADAIDAVGLQRERQLFGAKPEPDLAHRAEFGEAGEDGADRAGHCFVGMEPDLAVVVAPHEADRQAAAQLAAGCFVADAAFETGAEDVQLGFTHRALESEDQPVVEQGRMVHAVGIADQGVGHA